MAMQEGRNSAVGKHIRQLAEAAAARDGGMMQGGHHNRGRLHFAVGSDQLINRPEAATSELPLKMRKCRFC